MATPHRTAPWAILLALCLGFSLSQAYRSVAAIMAKPLQAEMGLGASDLGLFAAAFHFAFGLMQVFMGVSIDLHGVRRTVLMAFPMAAIGALLTALAPGFPSAVLGQVLIGVGCSPAFLVCTVFIAREFPPARFAAVSGAVMSVGGIGLLATGTPLAWLVTHTSWRFGFGALAIASAVAWVLMWLWVRGATTESPRHGASESLPAALRGFGSLLLQPPTWGILVLGACTYASFMSLRGLWLAPLLMERHGFSLVQSGHVALAISVVGLVGPLLAGRVVLIGLQRRRWIVRMTLLMAALLIVCGLSPWAWLTTASSLLLGLQSGYIVWQYADVRASVAEHLTGRALAAFTMAMFLGIAGMQWLTGLVGSMALHQGHEPYAVVLCTIAGLLALGALAFRLLPQSPRLLSEGSAPLKDAR